MWSVTFSEAFLLKQAICDPHDTPFVKLVQTGLPVRVKIKDSEEDAALLDISEEGIRVAIRDRGYTPSFLKQEDEVKVLIHFPESPQEEEFVTQVRRISDENGRVSLGLVFSELDISKKGLVSKFVSDLREFK